MYGITGLYLSKKINRYAICMYWNYWIQTSQTCAIKWSIIIFFQSLGVSPGLGGTALYVNGLLAPDLYLQRGKTFTFVVETGIGSDPDQTFHPVYFTSDPTGGHQLKSDFEAKVR